MARSTGGEGGNIYRYAYIIVCNLNQGRRRRKDVPFHRGGGKGENPWPEEKDQEGCPVPQGGGGGKHISLCLYNCM